MIRTLLRFFPKKKYQVKSLRRILVIAITALGGALWATPGLASLRASFLDAYIAVLTSPIGMEVLRHNPWTDQLYLFKKPLSLWKKLYRERFDAALLFHASQRLALPLAAAIGASRIVGTRGLNKRLDPLLIDPLLHAHEHEIVRRLRAVEAIALRGMGRSSGLMFYQKSLNRKALL